MSQALLLPILKMKTHIDMPYNLYRKVDGTSQKQTFVNTTNTISFILKIPCAAFLDVIKYIICLFIHLLLRFHLKFLFSDATSHFSLYSFFVLTLVVYQFLF